MTIRSKVQLGSSWRQSLQPLDFPLFYPATAGFRIKHSDQLVLDRKQRPHPRRDDRERITRARQAAEALFTPKRQVAMQSGLSSLPSADRSARKPRVLATATPAPVRRQEVEARASSEQSVTPEMRIPTKSPGRSEMMSPGITR